MRIDKITYVNGKTKYYDCDVLKKREQTSTKFKVMRRIFGFLLFL